MAGCQDPPKEFPVLNSLDADLAKTISKLLALLRTKSIDKNTSLHYPSITTCLTHMMTRHTHTNAPDKAYFLKTGDDPQAQSPGGDSVVPQSKHLCQVSA